MIANSHKIYPKGFTTSSTIITSNVDGALLYGQGRFSTSSKVSFPIQKLTWLLDYQVGAMVPNMLLEVSNWPQNQRQP